MGSTTCAILWVAAVWKIESNCSYLTRLCKTRNVALETFKVHLFLFTTPQTSPFYLKMLISIGLGKPNSFLEKSAFFLPDPCEDSYLDHPQFLRLKKKKKVRGRVVVVVGETIFYSLKNNTNFFTASMRLLVKDKYRS